MSDTWSARLSEYLDGTLTPAETRALERHLPECDACRAGLAELRSVVRSLASDPVSQADQPTEREWAAIRRAIAPSHRRWLVPVALAASLVGLAVVGGLLLRSREHTEPQALYLQASADLEAVLRDNRSRLRPETVKALQESMAQIDTAVAQAERALRADPANDYLTRYLGELRQARMMTLQQAVAVVHLKS
jgi:predicted anti-sigma-YlaC factor YlaD